MLYEMTRALRWKVPTQWKAITQRASIIACVPLLTNCASSVAPVGDAMSDGSDVSTPPIDTGICPIGTTSCGGMGCVNLETDHTNCGACANACPAIVNSTASCAMSTCSFACNPGFALFAGRCIAVGAFPRPIHPLSLGDVSLLRPTLRWELPVGTDGAAVEICRDRACTMVIESMRVLGTSVRPTMALPPRSAVFWRLRAVVGESTMTTYSATWLFHVPARDNSGAIDTSSHAHLDVNGDGFDDVAVGATYASPAGRFHAGMASVYHGSAVGIPRTPALVLEGVAEGASFGWSVSSAGDLNGDGFGDLVVGAIGGGAGSARVYHGSARGLAREPVRVIEGRMAGDAFGWSVASAGDLNGDGFGDLVVGAFLADPGGRDRAGTASVFHGSAAGVPLEPVSVLEGVAASDQYGWSVASAGDVNGDGFGDLVVGAGRASPGGRMEAGTASVFHGSAVGIPRVAARAYEGDVGALFGWSVAGAGDVNGDGFDEVVVGAPSGGWNGIWAAGTAAVFHGSAAGTALAPTQVIGGNAQFFGESVASAGDVNGDGFDDLVVGGSRGGLGDQSDVGRAIVYQGSVIGIANAPARVLDGTNYGRFGHSVAGAGDVNGDGFDDLVVGASLATVAGRVRAGAASMFHGSAIGIPRTPALVLEGVETYAEFGWSVAIAGDRLWHRRPRWVANWFNVRATSRHHQRG